MAIYFTECLECGATIRRKQKGPTLHCRRKRCVAAAKRSTVGELLKGIKESPPPKVVRDALRAAVKAFEN